MIDIAQFRVLFDEFSNATDYPDDKIQAMYDRAGLYITGNNSCTENLRLLMTAHLLRIDTQLSNPSVPFGQVQSATEDNVSVSLTPPPSPRHFLWWLNLTPYGAEIAVAISIKSAGGFYSGGGNNLNHLR